VYGETFAYADFAPLFKAELFDAGQWADLFVRSGAKYIVPTSKHHEGFCLWPSAEASRTWGRPWNSVEIGPRRDLIGELAAATRARGLKFGVYYSLYEWFNPLWLRDKGLYVDRHLIPQFKDLVTRYQPSIIFSDGEWDLTSREWKSEQLLAWLFNDSPSRGDVVVDDRWGKDTVQRHGTYFTTEYAAGMRDDAHPWEENRGMGFSYGLNRAEGLDDYRTSRELVLTLVDTVSRGGNLLLDIGPAADGTIPVIMQQRLADVGDWLRVNGEAIYGTRFAGRACQWSAGTLPGQELGRFRIAYKLMDQVGFEPRDGHAVKQVFFTRKPGVLYAITPGWPGESLVVRDIRVSPGSVVTLLGHREPLRFTAKGRDLEIAMPQVGPEGLPARYAYAFRIAGGALR
jgi:alpha-L-fucosidase